jgi:hypothetical protein
MSAPIIVGAKRLDVDDSKSRGVAPAAAIWLPTRLVRSNLVAARLAKVESYAHRLGNQEMSAQVPIMNLRDGK